MIDIIETNYNFTIDEWHEYDQMVSFVINGDIYLFVKYKRTLSDLNDLLDCCSFLRAFNCPVLSFVLNNKGKLLTSINNCYFILLKTNNNYRDSVDLFEIIDLHKRIARSNYFQKSYRNNWAFLWSKKLDYYEYQIRELGLEKSVIVDSFGYFAGLATNAISLANNSNKLFDKNIDKVTLSHRRIFYPNYALNYYNPLSFIFDLEVRDIAEYLKSAFFSGESILNDLQVYLSSYKLTRYSYQMLYARLLYPSYYFDLYDKVMANELDQEQILPILDKVNDFELFLKKAYLEISKYADIEPIDWIIRLEEH